MTAHRIDLGDGDGDRDGVGGRPYLRDGVWPVCTHEHVVVEGSHKRCARYGEPLSHFLRFDVRPEWGTAFPAGAHFSLFLCVACADAFIPPPGKPPRQLPARFWDTTTLEPGKNYCNYGWWYASLEPPDAGVARASNAELAVAPKTLSFAADDQGSPCVGGPPWPQEDGYLCACGATMAFLVQIPADFTFPTLPGAPEQRGTYSKTEYRVFLGNETVIFACPRGCHPRAVVPVNQ